MYRNFKFSIEIIIILCYNFSTKKIGENFMDKKLAQLGGMFCHLKGKYLLITNEGRLASNHKYDENQVSATLRYLNNGAFKGMFNILSIEDYKLALDMHYEKIIAKTPDKEERKLLNDEYKKRSKKLDSIYEQIMQAQPEM